MASDTDAPWEDEEWLRQKHTGEGMTIQEMADHADTTFDTVRYYMRKYNVERHGNSPPDAKYKDAEYLRREYWDNGKSLNEIGEQCDTDGVTIHQWMEKHDIPRRTPDQEKGTAWKDEDTLRRLYWDEGLTLEEIGDELGCDAGTVGNWMERLGVDRELPPEKKPASYRTNHRGYEMWRSKHNQRQHTLGVHQLLAIADGADPHKVFSGGEYNVHHINHIPWDNRTENIEVLTKSEHSHLHYKEREHGESGDFTS
jgi:DNA-binding transcriptional MerR regulator